MADTISCSREVGLGAPRRNRLRAFGHNVCKVGFIGTLGVFSSAAAAIIAQPEAIRTEVAKVETPPSDLELVRQRIRSSMYGEGLVKVLRHEVARRTYFTPGGERHQQTIARPVWIRIDEKDYVAGRDSLRLTSELEVWQLADRTELCGERQPIDSATELVHLGLDPSSWGFAAPGVGVVRSGFDTSADACREAMELAGIDEMPVI